MTPREHDTALAALYHDLDRARDRVVNADAQLYRLAGAQWISVLGSWGRSRRTTEGRIETLRVTEEVRDQILSDMDPDERNLSIGTSIAGGQCHLADRERERDTVLASIREMELAYTGWSRFFLVTSSAGHVHSSMQCSSCRPTTRYGWLPELSGKTEAQAVDELGPALCSVCFPSAPVEMVGGKITAAKAARLAA